MSHGRRCIDRGTGASISSGWYWALTLIWVSTADIVRTFQQRDTTLEYPGRDKQRARRVATHLRARGWHVLVRQAILPNDHGLSARLWFLCMPKSLHKISQDRRHQPSRRNTHYGSSTDFWEPNDSAPPMPATPNASPGVLLTLVAVAVTRAETLRFHAWYTRFGERRSEAPTATLSLLLETRAASSCEGSGGGLSPQR